MYAVSSTRRGSPSACRSCSTCWSVTPTGVSVQQIGRLRAWAGSHQGELGALTACGCVVYAEWLWLTHTVRYDALPDYLVVLDLWHPDAGFLPSADRDGRCSEVGLATPPLLSAAYCTVSRHSCISSGGLASRQRTWKVPCCALPMGLAARCCVRTSDVVATPIGPPIAGTTCSRLELRTKLLDDGAGGPGTAGHRALDRRGVAVVTGDVEPVAE